MRTLRQLNIKKGLIEECVMGGNYYLKEEAADLVKKLRTQRHSFENIRNILKLFDAPVTEDLCYAFF